GRGPVAQDAARGGAHPARTPSREEAEHSGGRAMSAPRMYPGIGPDERTTFAPYSAFDLPADLRSLHGRYDVESTARRVRNFRYAEEWLMMLMGGWVATIPELPVKTGLGKVIWETARAADEFGKRLPELRCGRKSLTQSEAGNAGFAALIQEV